jgi:hypothetical protein
MLSLRATVERVTGGTKDLENHGIVIRVNYNGAVPTLPQDVLPPSELSPSPLQGRPSAMAATASETATATQLVQAPLKPRPPVRFKEAGAPRR